jgi:hypothetical protein
LIARRSNKFSFLRVVENVPINKRNLKGPFEIRLEIVCFLKNAKAGKEGLKPNGLPPMRGYTWYEALKRGDLSI